MESAEQLGMRKFLASCEHCIAQDTSKKFGAALDCISTGSPARTADCIHRICVLRDYPIKTWSPERFLNENINYYRSSAKCQVDPLDSGSTL